MARHAGVCLVNAILAAELSGPEPESALIVVVGTAIALVLAWTFGRIAR